MSGNQKTANNNFKFLEVNKIRGFKIKIRKREILRILRYTSNVENISETIEKKIQEQVEAAYELIKPSVIYNTVPRTSREFDEIRKEIVVGSGKVNEMIEKSAGFTMLAATIGSELEKRVDEIKEQDMTDAFILDAAGSEAVEQSANFVSRILNEEAEKQECSIGLRFSPGYGDWPLEASRKILRKIPVEKIDIEMTDSGIIRPRKSITAIQTWIQEK